MEMRIGEALRMMRTINGLTQKEMAKALELSDSYVSELERDNRDPSLSVLQRYADYFQVPVSSILLFSESRGSESQGSGKKLVADKLLQIMRWAEKNSA
jgi:transcriptional regulator with XRE-family HTH domain